MVSEREAVLRERAAYVAHAIDYAFATGRSLNEPEVKRAAAERYPLPTVTRPRVVADPFPTSPIEWCALPWAGTGKAAIHVRRVPGGEWRVWTQESVAAASCVVTAERVALWADLLANPTETVEADADDVVSGREHA